MGWIPIEREAPKDGQKILVCYEDGTILGTRYNPRSLSTWLAWMPQPKPYTADTPQTDLLVKTPRKSRESHEENCETCRDKDAYDEWEGNCDECENGSMYTPQTDCETCKWGEWYRNGRDITTMDDECGGCCSWNNKWQPREPQTDCAWK